ncbi:plasma membrane fusion protein prm1 [Coemansia sp. IMI 203386]|nr:plasma membrane fusion protein prm1 [Coemansia sp. IMI 203386]
MSEKNKHDIIGDYYDTESEYDRYSMANPEEKYGMDKKNMPRYDEGEYKSSYPVEKATYSKEKAEYPNEKSEYPNEKATYPNEKYNYPADTKHDYAPEYPSEKSKMHYNDYGNNDMYYDDAIASPVKKDFNGGKSKGKGKGKGKEKIPLVMNTSAAPGEALDNDYEPNDDLYYNSAKPNDDLYYNSAEPNYDNNEAHFDLDKFRAPPEPQHQPRYRGSTEKHPDAYHNFNDDKSFDEKQYYYQEKQDPAHLPPYRESGPEGKHMIYPYVGKWARLSRSWATQTVILLIFMGYGYILMAGDARDKSTEALNFINSNCRAVETAAGAVVNAPRTAAESSLAMLEKAAQGLVTVAYNSLNKIINMIESLIVIVLKIYIGTFICIAEVIIRTALTMITEVGKIITDLLNKAIDSVMGTMQNFAANVANGAQNIINDVAGFFNGNDNTVDFNADEIRKELSVEIPSDWVNSISDLQNKIPTEEQIFGNVTALLDIPFNMLRGVIFAGFSKIDINFAESVKLPDEKNVTVCDRPIGEDTINGVGTGAARIFTIGGLAIIGAALILIMMQVYRNMRYNNRYETRMLEFRQDLAYYTPPINHSKDEVAQTPATRQEMDLYKLPGNRLMDTIVRWQRKNWGDTPRTLAWRWWFDYVLYPPAIACFLAGVIGIITVVVQVNSINGLRKEFTPILAREMDAFQQDVIGDQLIGNVRNDSVALADDINGSINSKELALNETLFGPIDDGTTYLNDTLNDFINTYITGIRSVFGGTVLEYPVEGFVNCTLTKNIRTLQKILTFINDYLGGIDLPRVDEDVLYTPAMKLLGPVNKTVDALRLVVVGTFVPNATELDPDWFLPESELESEKDLYQSSLDEAEDAAEDESERSKDSMEDMLDSLEDESEDSEDRAENSEDGIIPLSFGQDDNSTTEPAAPLRKRDESDSLVETPEGSDPEVDSDTTIETVDSLPDSSSLFSSLSSSPLPSSLPPGTPTSSESDDDDESLDTELGDLDDELLSLGIDPSSFPTLLSKEDVETAQKYGGYTGGLVGKLCDYYVGNLLDQIPSFIALIGVWVVLIIFGLFHVLSDYRKIKRYGLDRYQQQQQQKHQQQMYSEKRFH